MKSIFQIFSALILSTCAYAKTVTCKNSKMAVVVDEEKSRVTVLPESKVLFVKNFVTSPMSRFPSISGEAAYSWTVAYTFSNDTRKLTLKYFESRVSEISAQYTDSMGYPLTSTMYCKENQ